MVHLPVLLRETINLLNLQSGDRAIDCTLGDGGHARAIIERVSSGRHLLAIDCDSENISRAQQLKQLEQVVLVNDNFKNLKSIAESNHFFPVKAVLMDLGWSSTQFAESGRGFSFQKDEPIDMRFGGFRVQGIGHGNLTAADILNEWSEEEIGRIFREYGEERNWKEIARAIIQSRKKHPIKTTNDLIKIIQSSEFRVRNSRLHPATKVFQALRVAVNNELNNLAEALPQALDVLAPGGRLAVISFHSLEDRIVKQFFKSRKGKTLEIITKKPIIASREELKSNPRSRSAKLRVAEKI